MRLFNFFNISLLLAAIWPNANIAAVEMGMQGLGQVLIFPYYTTRADNDTILSINNTTEDVKAIKLQVLEGDNGQIVHSLNMYLGPFDVWTAGITLNSEGIPAIRSFDESCTVTAADGELMPLSAFGVAGQTFSSEQFTGDNADDGRQSVDRLREGYIQVIEMGTLSVELGAFAFNAVANAQGITGCQFFADAWGNAAEPQSVYSRNPQLQMQPPTGGLSGQAILINVPGARAAAYDAVALDQFYVPGGEDPASLHTSPIDLGMGLAAASPAISRVLLANQGTDMQIITDSWDNGFQAVDAVLMVERFTNQFAAEGFIGGLTEWVVTFPGKREHVSQVDTPLPPYTSLFVSTQEGIPDCEIYVPQFFDREQFDTDNTGIPLEPPFPLPPSFCYEVNVVAFNNSVDSIRASLAGGGGGGTDSAANEAENILSDLWASRLFVNFDFPLVSFIETGWGSIAFNTPAGIPRMDVDQFLVNPVSDRVYQGLPVVGTSFQGATNAGLNALFAAGAKHHYQRAILAEE